MRLDGIPVKFPQDLSVFEHPKGYKLNFIGFESGSSMLNYNDNLVPENNEMSILFEKDNENKSNLFGSFVLAKAGKGYIKLLNNLKENRASVFSHLGDKNSGILLNTFNEEIEDDYVALLKKAKNISKKTLQFAVETEMNVINDSSKTLTSLFGGVDSLISDITEGINGSIEKLKFIDTDYKPKESEKDNTLSEYLNKIDESVLATELEEYGIGALFRGTTRNVEGELFAGNTSSIANGTSTSTDPIRAVIFGIESSSKPGRKGFLQIFVPRELEGLNLQAPNNSFKLELEVIVNTSPENLSKFAVIEIPIEDARKLIEKVYGVSLDTKIPRDYSRFLLEDTKKLTPKEALEFYKRAIKLTVKK